MKEKPILFSGKMIRAILDDRKSQTRRPITPQPKRVLGWNGGCLVTNQIFRDNRPGLLPPFGRPGDRLWVRETFAIESNVHCFSEDYHPPFDDGRPVKWLEQAPDLEPEYWMQAHYRATDPKPELCYPDMDEPGCRWKPSIHMPRWASRITLEITNVWAERVQGISIEDIKAEGLDLSEEWDSFDVWMAKWEELWDSIYAARGLGIDVNPWAWVYEFKKVGNA